MRILAVGDVCGQIGCDAVRRILPKLKKQKNIDTVIINAENSADGNGVTVHSANELFLSGADVLTGGNHSLRRREVYGFLDESPFLLRPHNFSGELPGKGYCILDCGYLKIAVINLAGTVYLEKSEAGNPFKAADELIKRAEEDGAKVIIADFHAEATSEKRALGIYLDSRVSAFFGTHTHVQTSDSVILKNGTAYITDIGMVGPEDSVLGVESSIIINRLKDGDQSKFRLAEGPCIFNACIFEIDNCTGKALSIERISITERELH